MRRLWPSLERAEEPCCLDCTSSPRGGGGDAAGDPDFPALLSDLDLNWCCLEHFLFHMRVPFSNWFFPVTVILSLQWWILILESFDCSSLLQRSRYCLSVVVLFACRMCMQDSFQFNIDACASNVLEYVTLFAQNAAAFAPFLLRYCRRFFVSVKYQLQTVASAKAAASAWSSPCRGSLTSGDAYSRSTGSFSPDQRSRSVHSLRSFQWGGNCDKILNQLKLDFFLFSTSFPWNYQHVLLKKKGKQKEKKREKLLFSLTKVFRAMGLGPPGSRKTLTNGKGCHQMPLSIQPELFSGAFTFRPFFFSWAKKITFSLQSASNFGGKCWILGIFLLSGLSKKIPGSLHDTIRQLLRLWCQKSISRWNPEPTTRAELWHLFLFSRETESHVREKAFRNWGIIWGTHQKSGGGVTWGTGIPEKS